MFTGISKSKPDGQIIGMGVSTPILMQLVMRPEKLPFDADSFDYLSGVALGQLALVASANAPFDDLESMVDYAKANGPMAIAINASPHKPILAAISKKTGAEFEFVPTDGGAESMKLLLGGQVMASFAGGSHGPYIDSGDMKMIAVGNSERHDYAPDVMTVAEQGYECTWIRILHRDHQGHRSSHSGCSEQRNQQRSGKRCSGGNRPQCGEDFGP